MSIWFECKVKYQKMMPNGAEKSVTEPYLIDAVSFTEAESRIHKEMEPYISGDFSVTNIKIANYSELHPNDSGDRWFKCKVSFITVDEEKGVEKKSNTYMLVQANNVKEAYENLEKALSDMASDYEIPVVQESPLMDVFTYFGDDEEKPRRRKEEKSVKTFNDKGLDEEEEDEVYIDEEEDEDEGETVYNDDEE